MENKKVWAERAVDAVMPAVLALMDKQVFSRRDLHIVIARPGSPQEDLPLSSWQLNGILYEHSLGSRDDWEYDFFDLARKKTWLSWRYGMNAPHLQFQCPYLLDDGDARYVGSASRDGLTVGVSGVQSHFCQMIAEWVLEAFRCMSLDTFERERRARKAPRQHVEKVIPAVQPPGDRTGTRARKKRAVPRGGRKSAKKVAARKPR